MIHDGTLAEVSATACLTGLQRIQIMGFEKGGELRPVSEDPVFVLFGVC